MANTHSGTAPDYFVPMPSNWPMVGMIAMILNGFGAAMLVNKVPFGGWVLLAGFAVLIYMLFGWFGTVIGESETGRYRHKEDLSFRWGMGWFIFSEVMFFASFFGALFYARVITLPASSRTSRRSMPGRCRPSTPFCW
jgi:cytochrome c oxidase subunit III